MPEEIEYLWTCRCCGRAYRTLPLDYAFDAPIYWEQLSEEERRRSFLGPDICTIGEDRFIRGCLEIPVHGREERLVWGVWASLSEASLARILELWDAPGIAPEEPARFGWLSNDLSRIYGVSTLNLKTMVRLRAGKLRPLIEIEPSDHSLAREQSEGISLERVQEIAARLLHRH